MSLQRQDKAEKDNQKDHHEWNERIEEQPERKGGFANGKWKILEGLAANDTENRRNEGRDKLLDEFLKREGKDESGG